MARRSTPELNIRSIMYSRTFNNGNYESSKIEVTVDVLSADNPDDIFGELVEKVENWRVVERG